MAPRYMADKSFGKSLYNSDFNGRKVGAIALLAHNIPGAAKLARELSLQAIEA